MDVVEVSVFQVPDLSKTVAVSGNGQIDLPLIGAVTAAGRTTEELEKEIADKLGAKYLQSPQVSVFVKDYVSQRITVEGAVNKPGVYQIQGRSTLLQAMAMAGGVTRIASADDIAIFRNVGGQRQAAVFSLSDIRHGKKPDPVIMAGDYIVVDESVAKRTFANMRETLGVFSLLNPFF